MKRMTIIITAALAALLCSSCGEFYDGNNILCIYPWQLDSTITYNQLGEQIARKDYGAGEEILEFEPVGAWLFTSTQYNDNEGGNWSSEQIPQKGPFVINFVSYNPGYFIKEGHSGEDYRANISEDGRNLKILHAHTDEDEMTIQYFTQISE